MEKIDIFGLPLIELQTLFIERGIKKFRAMQVFDWLYDKKVQSFEEMRNISKDDIKRLADNFIILPAHVKILREQVSEDGLTRKILIELLDGSSVESVCMQHDYGFSVCISSQVGCNMACDFCASGITGLERNLTAGEIVLQVYIFTYILHKQKSNISRVVVMGSGEPFLNYENVMTALDFLHDEHTLHLSYRGMTVSTCGIVPIIEKMSEKGVPINLAVSLHAATNEKRSALMPINNQFPIEILVTAAEKYAKITGRQVTYEYILLAGVNDTKVDAEILSHLLRYKNASVNLIPANPVPEKGFKRPSNTVVDTFLQVLKKNKIKATVRKEMGKDIDAACGQLRANFLQAK